MAAAGPQSGDSAHVLWPRQHLGGERAAGEWVCGGVAYCRAAVLCIVSDEALLRMWSSRRECELWAHSPHSRAFRDWSGHVRRTYALRGGSGAVLKRSHSPLCSRRLCLGSRAAQSCSATRARARLRGSLGTLAQSWWASTSPQGRVECLIFVRAWAALYNGLVFALQYTCIKSDERGPRTRALDTRAQRAANKTQALAVCTSKGAIQYRDLSGEEVAVVNELVLHGIYTRIHSRINTHARTARRRWRRAPARARSNTGTSARKRSHSHTSRPSGMRSTACGPAPTTATCTLWAAITGT